MNCHYHSDVPASYQCENCEKSICQDCHDSEYPGYCYSCSLDFRNGAKAYNTAEYSANKSKLMKKIIGWYEIIGGIIGAVLTIVVMLKVGLLQQFLISLIFFVFLVLFLISITSGVLLLRQIKWGETLSMIIQSLQIPKFIIGGTAYSFIAGAKLSIMFSRGLGTGFGVDFGIFSEFNFHVNSYLHGILFGVNLVPIVVIFLLLKYRRVR